MHVARFIWAMRHYFRLVVGQLALGSLAGIARNTLVVLPAVFLGRAVDAAVACQRGEIGKGEVAWAAVWLFLATALTEVPRIGKRWWFATSNARLMANVRADALRGVLAWPMARIDRMPVGDVMARINGDVDVLGRGTGELTRETWDTLLFSVSLIVAMLAYDAELTALALLPVPVAMVLAHAAGRWVHGRTVAARSASAALTTCLEEQLTGLRVLRLFGRGSAATARVEALSEKQKDANLAMVRLQGGLVPIYTIMMTAGVVVVVWLGGLKVVAGQMAIGSFLAYLMLFRRFVDRGARVPQMLNCIQAGAAAFGRLEPLLADAVPPASEPPLSSFRADRVAGVDLPTPPGQRGTTQPVSVSIQSLTFRYPDAPDPVLQGIDLEVPAGDFIAITGSVGSGKTALARAMLGLFPLESGRVLLGGVDIADIPQAERAGLCGYLPQDPPLFSGTIAQNMLLGLATQGHEALLARLVASVALGEDLESFPHGLETEIGEMGVRISGGQRQRIALARTMVGSGNGTPGLLILDDPFSALDAKTEAQIIAHLCDAFGPTAPPEQRATIVMFSHRLAAFTRADMVVVLEAGRIEELGTHKELIEAGGLYSRIHRAQRRAAGSGGEGQVSP
jgi:ATP-binding cassette, subfamily B, multidrug efflux pump